MAKSYSQAIRNNEYLDINMPTEMFSAGFSFLDGLQDLILIAAAIDNAKDNDIRFLLIDQVIGNIIFHQNTPHVIPFQIRVVDRPACFWCLTDFFQFLFQFIRKGGGGVGIYQVTRDIVKGIIAEVDCLQKSLVETVRCNQRPDSCFQCIYDIACALDLVGSI